MQIHWSSKLIPITELTPLKNNPRRINSSEFKKLERDHKLGTFKPIVCNADYTILAGNQRYQYYKQKGIEEIWCSVPDEHLTEKQAKEIVMLDNTHRGEFDIDMLANEFEDTIKNLGLDFKLPRIPDYSDKNKEIDLELLEGKRKIVFEVDNDNIYFELLELIAQGVVKGGFNTNEELLIHLLQDYAKR